MEGVLGIDAFEIVRGVENALAAGLSLATCQRAEGIEPPGDGAGKAGFSFAIRCNRAKDWWLRLVGSVGSANALNGFVGAPSKFEKEVDTGLLVAVIQAGVIAAACSSGI